MTRPLVLAMLVGWLFAPPRLDAAETVDYLRDVKPILTRRCLACHGALKQKSGLRLDTAARLLQGGESGPAVVAGKSDESLLIEAVSGDDDWRMPPEGEPLSVVEIDALKAWIDQGAKAPAVENGQIDPRRHWAFLKPVRREPPRVKKAEWSRNPVDAFLAAEHEARGLEPSPPADRAVLLRRVYLDLIGLVPTPEERRDFLADPSDEAYEKVVDRLLASPHYGERWGRHWMDVWRYSDWDGFGAEVRESQPHIWRWRDWIVESLNHDKGYDRMIVEMLAADEASPDDPDALRATGFLARNWYKFNRNVWLDNTVEHTGKAFLGLTFNCARCHDHKYDPIAQQDYYRFRAFFEPHQVRADRVPGEADPLKDGLVRVYDADSKAPTYLFERGDDKRPVKDKPLAPGLPELLARGGVSIASIGLSTTAHYPSFRRFVQDESLARARNDVAARQADLAKAPSERAQKALVVARADLKAIELKVAADLARYAIPPRSDADRLARAAGRADRLLAVAKADEAVQKVVNALADAKKALKAGDEKTKKAVADAETAETNARKALATAQAAIDKEAPAYASLGPVYPSETTGRRLALARWIASADNPLTARVAVNHIWLRHFGSPIVATVFDFGQNGKPPTHAALLDWLAVELMERSWSTKAIHRLIVTSQAYRMQASSVGTSNANLAIDPANQWLWRMNPRRMEAEAVRDNVLRVAGRLDPALGGPDLDPKNDVTTPRRSLYFRHTKEKRVTFLRLFDSANVASCYRRSESVVPQQALALANSPLAFEQSRRLARALSAEASAGGDAAFVTLAFERVLGRDPTSEERVVCASYLVDQAKRLGEKAKLTPFASGPASALKPSEDPALRAREDLVHVLFNHNDFVTIR